MNNLANSASVPINCLIGMVPLWLCTHVLDVCADSFGKKTCWHHIWFWISWLLLYCVLCILLGKQVFTRWHFKAHVCLLFKSSGQGRTSTNGQTWPKKTISLICSFWKNTVNTLPGPKLAIHFQETVMLGQLFGTLVPNHCWNTLTWNGGAC